MKPNEALLNKISKEIPEHYQRIDSKINWNSDESDVSELCDLVRKETSSGRNKIIQFASSLTPEQVLARGVRFICTDTTMGFEVFVLPKEDYVFAFNESPLSYYYFPKKEEPTHEKENH